MGYGIWTNSAYTDYAKNRGFNTVSINGVDTISGDYSVQQLYHSHNLDSALDPKGVVRECCDSNEHPNTIPVILALDVTGSMGNTAISVAKKLNEIMTNLYEEIPDIQFMTMGIGDLAYDSAPIQASQFEADIRIAEQLEKIYFERGGGGNGYESYTAAWYFGLYHTKLDCWKRGKKGIIITMGDEALNPYLPKRQLARVTGDNVESDIETEALYNDVIEKFDVYHLAIKEAGNCYNMYRDRAIRTFTKYLNNGNFDEVNLDSLASVITNIIKNNVTNNGNGDAIEESFNMGFSEIAW